MKPNKGDSQLVKEVNKRLVLGLIEGQSIISRADIARSLRLSPTTVSALTNELLEEELINELGSYPSHRGRRPVMYKINSEARFIVGADVGSNDITVIVTDIKFKVIKETHTDVDNRVGQELIRTLCCSIEECINLSKVDRAKIIGIGLACPGLVDSKNGIVMRSVNAEWENTPLKGILEHELSLPVYIENMNRAAALGEYARGLDRKVSRLLYLNIGNGVGAALIVDGLIMQGSKVSAGELGHVVMDRYGEKCNCGARGCLETLVSAKALKAQARRMVKQFPGNLILELAGGDVDQITFETISQAAKEHDNLAINIFTQAAEWTGFAVAGMVNIFNPELIMIGGRVVRAAGDMFTNTVRNIAKGNSFPVLFETTTFMTPKLGNLSSSIGGVAFVLQKEFRSSFLDLGEFPLIRS